MSCIGFEAVVQVVQFRYVNETSLFRIKRSPNLIHIWVDIVVVEDCFVQTLRAIQKDRLLADEDQVRTFHHISCTIIVEIKIAYFNPVGIIVIHRFVKANEPFFLKVLTADDSIVLIFEFKNLWVAEMIGGILWLINEDLVDFFEVSILV